MAGSHQLVISFAPRSAEAWQACVQSQDARLLPVARSAGDAKVMLEALEAGTDGVVLHTQEPAQASRA